MGDGGFRTGLLLLLGNLDFYDMNNLAPSKNNAENVCFYIF